MLLRQAAGVPKLGGLRVNAGGIAGGIRLALHSATRMSPGLRPPPLFRSAERSTILIERRWGFRNHLNPVLQANNVACSAVWVNGAAK
jgi:hypothetical protein